MRLSFSWVAVPLAAGGLAISASSSAATDAAPITVPDGASATVLATTSIWADIVGQLDCHDAFTVEALMPTGTDPHSYEPSLRDRDRLGEAALVVENGAQLEIGLVATIEAAAADGANVVTVTDLVTTHGFDDDHDEDGHDHDDGHDDDHDDDDHDHDDDGHDHDDDGHDHDDDGHDHDHGDVDPHLWLDPTLVVEALPGLGAAMADAGGLDDGALDDCVAELSDDLTALDTEIDDLVATLSDDQRLLVTNHDALGYFARRYGFEVLGTVLPSTSTLVEASPAEMDALAEAITEAGVPAIFAEELDSADDATALGERLGIEVVTLFTDSLGEPGSGADTYQTMMIANAVLITDALGVEFVPGTSPPD